MNIGEVFVLRGDLPHFPYSLSEFFTPVQWLVS